MKLKTLSTIILPTILSVTACGDDSSNNSKTIPLNKPKADYNFNDLELAELLLERSELLSGTLTYNGKSYQAIFGTNTGEDDMLVQFENRVNKNERISMFVPIEPTDSSSCVILGTNYSTAFDCNEQNVSSKNEHLITYQATSNSGLESFTLEVSQYLPYMGSTEFKTIDKSNDKYTIITSSPFDKYGYTQTDLGASSYIGLSKILTNIGKGNDITLIFNNQITGSSDDDINMYTGLMLRDYSVKTHISKTGAVFSGGTDLFTAGVKRTIELKNANLSVKNNQQIGVHSWSEDKKDGNEVDATNIPYTDMSHRRQATYFYKMLGDKGVDFYVFTIKSAPSDGAHYMTIDELKEYNIISE